MAAFTLRARRSIKWFADSAGKKAGEFYTPADVVRTMVELVEPQAGMSIYDPTCGSGGMLIQSRDYITECGGDPRDLSLFGQESFRRVTAVTMKFGGRAPAFHGIRLA